ncbi:MAG: tetratricopeptide repeat protein [Lautropia sp.]
MSALTFLLLVLVPLAIAATAYVVWPLLRHGRPVAGDEHAAELNRTIVAERRAQLDRELAALPAGSPERERLVLEFTSTALDDLAPAAVRGAAGHDAAVPVARPRWVLAALLTGTLLAAPIAFYRVTGLPAAVEPGFAELAATPTLAGAIRQLEARLAADPNAIDGWLLLGRARLAQGDAAAALTALERALTLPTDDAALAAQVRVDLADAIAQRAPTRLAGRPWELIQDALRRDPSNQKALALAGAYQVTHGNPAAALGYWETLLAQLPPDSEQHATISGFIADIRGGQRPGTARAEPDATAGAPAPTPAPQSPPASPVTSSAGASLRGRVELGAAFAGAATATPDRTVFIVARAVDERGEPVGPPAAVRRIRLADLPYAFELGDADAMGPMAKLSTQSRVIVVARVSASGTAAPAPGDLEGRSAVVAPGAADVMVRIDRVLP